MDNKIPDGQLRKVLDPLTVIVFLFFTRLLLFAENISFCNNRKLYKRILEAFSGMAVNHHDLSGIEDTLAVLSIKGVHPLILKILCQTLCPCAGA